MAVMEANGFVIELIEPDENPSTFREFLTNHGAGVHHLGFEVGDKRTWAGPVFSFFGALRTTIIIFLLAYFGDRSRMTIILAGCVVSYAGLLSFVGLIVPHISRKLFDNVPRSPQSEKKSSTSS